ncbi:hypothetical protein EKI60_02675 [Candidatus Saccharibacteria bacterium]|nr:MAG: hypothetical protein EKI60_02675 [Candidatus Saccharibacteria bacterium]
MKTEPKYRRPLNTHQIAILNTLYKFRFTTTALLAENQQAKHQRVISNRLKILVDQGYIGMNYDSSYKIKGKPATYYLLTDGVRFLRDQPYTQESALRSIYQDKRANDSRIQHRLNVFKTYITIKQTYPDRFKLFSKTELMNKPYVPKTRPDAFLIDNQSDKSYFVDYLEDTMSFWTLRKAIRRYITFAELEIWQKYKLDQPHPNVLFICESAQLIKRVDNLIRRELDSSYVDIQMTASKLDDLILS